MPKKGYKKVEYHAFKQGVDEYLNDCVQQNKTPFLVELAKILGISDDTLLRYRTKPPSMRC